MAGNMTQMALNGQLMLQQAHQAQQQQQQQQQQQHQQRQQQPQTQTQNKQIHNLIYSGLMQSMGAAPGSWQSQVPIADRFAKTSTLYGSNPPEFSNRTLLQYFCCV